MKPGLPPALVSQKQRLTCLLASLISVAVTLDVFVVPASSYFQDGLHCLLPKAVLLPVTVSTAPLALQSGESFILYAGRFHIVLTLLLKYLWNLLVLCILTVPTAAFCLDYCGTF